jgi:hypothetical protein
MSDGKSEESDGFFGIDNSTKENKNNVEVPVGEQIDDDEPFFADADDHNEGGEIDDYKSNNGNAQDDNDSTKGEGAIEGSKYSDIVTEVLFYSSGSDSVGGKDKETKGRNKDKEANMIQERNFNDQPFGKDHYNVRT